MSVGIRRLGPPDIGLARDVNRLFGEAFDDPGSYGSAPPGEAYLKRLLGRSSVIALAAFLDGELAGALVAYVFEKLEQERNEVYIYDLAVAESHRRRGVATALIEEVRRIASESGAWVIYIQADRGDEPAIALYDRLGAREEVLHFDIAPRATR